MLNRETADEVVEMLREGAPTIEILRRANDALPSTSHVLALCTEASLRTWSQELRTWVESALRLRPPPTGLKAIWFSVQLPRLMIQGHPETLTGDDWTLVEWWDGTLAPWSAPPLELLGGKDIPGRESAE